MATVLSLIVFVFIRWALQPRFATGTLFIVYKSLVVLAAWLLFVLSAGGIVPPFVGASSTWVFLFGAVLLSAPTLVVGRRPVAP